MSDGMKMLPARPYPLSYQGQFQKAQNRLLSQSTSSLLNSSSKISEQQQQQQQQQQKTIEEARSLLHRSKSSTILWNDNGDHVKATASSRKDSVLTNLQNILQSPTTTIKQQQLRPPSSITNLHKRTQSQTIASNSTIYKSRPQQQQQSISQHSMSLLTPPMLLKKEHSRSEQESLESSGIMRNYSSVISPSSKNTSANYLTSPYRELQSRHTPSSSLKSSDLRSIFQSRLHAASDHQEKRHVLSDEQQRLKLRESVQQKLKYEIIQELKQSSLVNQHQLGKGYSTATRFEATQHTSTPSPQQTGGGVFFPRTFLNSKNQQTSAIIQKASPSLSPSSSSSLYKILSQSLTESTVKGTNSSNHTNREIISPQSLPLPSKQNNRSEQRRLTQLVGISGGSSSLNVASRAHSQTQSPPSPSIMADSRVQRPATPIQLRQLPQVKSSVVQRQTSQIFAGAAPTAAATAKRSSQLFLSSLPPPPAPLPPSSSSDSSQKRQIVSCHAVLSKAGSQPGKIVKKNQDSYIVTPNFCKDKQRHFFSVCDGHGTNGHLASQFIKRVLSTNLEQYLKPLSADQLSPSHLNQARMKEAIADGFKKTQAGLLDSGIDINFSGSTCVGVYVTSDKYVCANIGDSRAVLGRFDISRNSWTSHPLSIDHKPDLPKEKQRIIASGGRVDSFKGQDGIPSGPARVWLRNENTPGLAMSRSFGDYVASQVGVIAEPEILQFEVSACDRFLVVASDGLWEFLSNEEVTNIVAPFFAKNDPNAACEKLIRQAQLLWKQEDECVDDITVIVVFLNK